MSAFEHQIRLGVLRLFESTPTGSSLISGARTGAQYGQRGLSARSRDHFTHLPSTASASELLRRHLDARAEVIRDILYSRDQLLVLCFPQNHSWRNLDLERLWANLSELVEDQPNRQRFVGQGRRGHI